ncbi:MAG: phage tail tape measure protein, partial [Aliidongia sp.]
MITSAETTFAAQAEVKYEDFLSPALVKAAELALKLDSQVGVLAASLKTVEEIANRLGDNKGLSKLVKSFKTDGLAAGFSEASEKADLFAESMKAVGLDTERFAELGARMMNPMVEGVEKAQRQLAELDRQLAKTPPGHRFDNAVPGGREPGEERGPGGVRRRSREPAVAYDSGVVGKVADVAMGVQMDAMVARMVASPAIKSLGLAGEMQAALLVIKAEHPGTTDADMLAMRRAAEESAKPTQFSAVDEAKILQQIVSGTGLSIKESVGLLPVISKYADVQKIAKDVPYDTSVKDALGLAHNMHFFKPEELEGFLDTLNKASMFIPESTSAMANALKYDASILTTEFGMSPKDAVLANAMADRVGFSGSRGGTNLANAIQRAMPGVFGSGLLKGKSGQALHHIGIVDDHGQSTVFNKAGKFDLLKFLERIERFEAKEFKDHPKDEKVAREDIAKSLRWAFGASDKLITALAAPESVDAFRDMSRNFDQMGTATQMQDTFANDSVLQQFKTAQTNIDTAFTELGSSVLPQANAALKLFNRYISQFNDYVSQNQWAGKVAVGGSLGLAGLVGAGIVAGVLKFAWKSLFGGSKEAGEAEKTAAAAAKAADPLTAAAGGSKAAADAAAARAEAEALF